MPPARGGRSVPRRTTPQSPQKSLSSRSSPKQARRSARSSSREAEPAPRQQHVRELELDPVAEEHASPDPGNVDPSINISVTESSDGNRSELQSLNVLDILEALPDLQDGAQKVIQFFNRRNDQLEQLVQNLLEKSAVFKTFSRRMAYFFESRAPFSNRVFITPELISRKLHGPLDAEETWKPDAILYLANLAVFIATMFTGDADRKDELFQNIYSQYPAVFMPLNPRSSFATNLVSETISFGNSLRTQFFIMMAEKRQNDESFDPESILRELFMNEDLTFKGLDFADAEASAYQELIEDRMRAIRAFFTKSPISPIKLVPLRQAFPLIEFLEDTVQWCNLRSQELEVLIDDQGGAAGIVEHLTDKEAEEIVLSFNGAPAPRGARQIKQAWGKNNANLARLKNINLENAARTAGSDLESESPLQLQSLQGENAGTSQGLEQLDDFAAPLDMDDRQFANLLSGVEPDVIATEQPSQVPRVMAELALSRANENKRFTDPQVGAQRLNFDDQDTQQSRAHVNGKRHATADSEDNEFETDTREPVSKRARQDNIDPRLRNVALVEWEPNETTPSEAVLPPSNSNRRAGQRSKPRLTDDGDLPRSSAPAAPKTNHSPGSTDVRPSNADSPPFAASQKFRNVQQEAKNAMRRMKLMNSTMPELGKDGNENDDSLPTFTQRATSSSGFQDRRAWTPLEEQRLIEFIGAIGPHYSRILKEDSEDRDPKMRGSLANRNQVQLKDKARNIKFAYLKAGRELPEGFGPVSIGNVMVQKLSDVGIDVHGDGRHRNIAPPRSATSM